MCLRSQTQGFQQVTRHTSKSQMTYTSGSPTNALDGTTAVDPVHGDVVIVHTLGVRVDAGKPGVAAAKRGIPMKTRTFAAVTTVVATTFVVVCNVAIAIALNTRSQNMTNRQTSASLGISRCEVDREDPKPQRQARSLRLHHRYMVHTGKRNIREETRDANRRHMRDTHRIFVRVAYRRRNHRSRRKCQS